MKGDRNDSTSKFVCDGEQGVRIQGPGVRKIRKKPAFSTHYFLPTSLHQGKLGTTEFLMQALDGILEIDFFITRSRFDAIPVHTSTKRIHTD